MQDFLNRYPYFTSASVISLFFLIGVALFPSHRRIALWSALIASPFALWALALVPEYWTPANLLRVGRLGIEDLIWALATGGLAWLSAAAPCRFEGVLLWDGRQVARRLSTSVLIGMAIFSPLFLLGVQGMIAFAAGVGGLGLVLICRRPHFWNLAIAGALGFGVINLLATKLTSRICPDYFLQMTPSGLSGWTFWGLPVEECYWAVVTGATWPLMVIHTFEQSRSKSVVAASP